MTGAFFINRIKNLYINLLIFIEYSSNEEYNKDVERGDIMNYNTFLTYQSSTLSISELTRAGEKKIFDNLKNDRAKIILKNNMSIAVLLSTERYEELLEKEENLQLIQIALEREKAPTEFIIRKDFHKNNGIDEEYIKNLPEIDLE